MPKTRLDKYSAPKRDALKGLIFEYMAITNTSKSKLANITGYSRATITRRMKEHSDEWPIKFIKQISKEIKIPEEEIKQAAKF